MDYVTALLKQGIPQDQAMAANAFWLRLGLKQILLGRKRYALRVLEET